MGPFILFLTPIIFGFLYYFSIRKESRARAKILKEHHENLKLYVKKTVLLKKQIGYDVSWESNYLMELENMDELIEKPI